MCVKPNEDISLTKCELLCIVYGIILTLFCYLFGVIGYSVTQKWKRQFICTVYIHIYICVCKTK